MKRYSITRAAFGAAALFFAGTVLAAGNSWSTAKHQSTMNWYGGPVYHGQPALKVTAALVKAGGGAANFSFPKALVAMLGEKTVNAEAAKLTKQYGKKQVDMWLNGMTYAVKEGLRQATAAGVKLPAAPADLTGTKLAATLVKAGLSSNDTFWAGLMFDHALSHKLHDAVMANINQTKGGFHDMVVHKITNQAMYDVAHALGMNHVRLATLH